MGLVILSVAIRHEQDIVTARRRAREIAGLLHYDAQDATRIATAVSEIARNALVHGGGGMAEFFVEQETPASLAICIGDRGKGIADVNALLSGSTQGTGIASARRLMDSFQMESPTGAGTTVWLRKVLPPSAEPLTPRTLADMKNALIREPLDFYEEVRQQNQELLLALDQLRERQEQLDRLNRELQETNRGVVALYGELAEKADQLQEAGLTKSRFLSHMSHEFRTPLNAILGLTRLLLKRPEVAASEEAVKEISYVRRSAETLTEMVNDLLDLAKAESGKLEARVGPFDVDNLLGTLRGMFRPFFSDDTVNLVFEEAGPIPPMNSDEEKLAQILRNFLSNALKFTERGEVRVSTSYSSSRDTVCFSVHDTGVGIAQEHHRRIFEEFAQIENPLQRRTKGTGLGLPLCKKLAQLLGGSVRVESRLGVGSTFTAEIPRIWAREGAAAAQEPTRSLLAIDDEEIARYLLRQLMDKRYELREASSGSEGLEAARRLRPDAIFLDLNMPGMDGFEVLARLQADTATHDIPVVIVTEQKLDEGMRAALAGRVAGILAKEALAQAEGLTLVFGPPFSVAVQYNQSERYAATIDTQCG